MKSKVLIFTHYYTPSVKGGGPIQSIKNLVKNLEKKLEFYVVTSDRDLGDKKKFNDINRDTWIEIDNHRVMYVNAKTLTPIKLKKIMMRENFTSIYLNSFFNFRFSILPLLVNKFSKDNKTTTVLAPRGEFSKGALGLKWRKKQLYLKIFKVLFKKESITWHATSEHEKEDIYRVIQFGEIKIANNLTEISSNFNMRNKIEKEKNKLNVIFLSRIHPKKNLLQALNILKDVKGNIKFNIYGPLEDQDYWKKCQYAIKELPDNIEVKYHGLVEHEAVNKVFKENHLFLFPTLGENFGHVISEALKGGCIVLLSNRTPWRDLEKEGIGWDLDLIETNAYAEKIQYCVEMDKNEFERISKRCFDYGINQTNTKADIANNQNLFL